MGRYRRTSAVAMSAALVLVLSDLRFAGAETTATLPEGTVVYGVVTNSSVPVQGASATLRVWPNEATLEGLPDDTNFDLHEAPAVTTNADGQYNIQLDPTTLPAEYKDPDNSVDFEVIVSDQVVSSTQGATGIFYPPAAECPPEDPCTLSTTTSSTASWGTGDGEAVPSELNFDLAADTASGADAATVTTTSATADIDSAAGPGVTSAKHFGTGAARGSSTTTTASGGGCTMGTGERHGPYLERFMTMYGTSYVKGRVIQHDGGDHTLGIAVKYPGSSTWSAGGTSTRGASWGYNTPYDVADAHVHNKIYHRYYIATCITSSGIYTTKYSKPSTWHSGPYYSYAPHVDYAYCSPGYKGHEYYRTSYKNGTYSGGVDLPFINLSAQSGWNSEIQGWWKFYRNGKLCGSNEGWATARRVSARA